MKIHNANLNSKGKKYAVILARFNEFIVSKLLDGCIDALKRHGANDEDIEVFWVPGSFEIPLIAKTLAKTGKYDALIALGAVIRGSTSHYELISTEVAKGVASSSLETGVPIVFGVLTTENIEQAIERAGTKMGNKGFDAAVSAIEMANLMGEIRE
ncbi:MAG: 6,7-dimethyl-8-ribityllumazine synthase [Peptoniphilaceae bacterium]|nr:6,7-dimethyl-8-ribityllumazine synthase [Peptoniphilaceae bacterium]MDD7383510.1 6,7-dimethyl-8-ribityllumazine synthase [Peptoniphilaceae bacterium]MDY3738683.1 6,7-dimethyl-8-ribityllumazine synthase [Peptoniphilaceae bacterium]